MVKMSRRKIGSAENTFKCWSQKRGVAAVSKSLYTNSKVIVASCKVRGKGYLFVFHRHGWELAQNGQKDLAKKLDWRKHL